MTILLVEGDEVYRQVICEFLTTDCFEVLETGEGSMAFTIIREHSPSLIITSLRLGDMNGLDFVYALKHDSMTAWIPIIVLTGDIAAQSFRRATDLGVDAFLSKPIDLTSLLTTVKKILIRAYGVST